MLSHLIIFFSIRSFIKICYSFMITGFLYFCIYEIIYSLISLVVVSWQVFGQQGELSFSNFHILLNKSSLRFAAGMKSFARFFFRWFPRRITETH